MFVFVQSKTKVLWIHFYSLNTNFLGFDDSIEAQYLVHDEKHKNNNISLLQVSKSRIQMSTNIYESVNLRELTPTKLVNNSKYNLPNYFQITTLYTAQTNSTRKCRQKYKYFMVGFFLLCFVFVFAFCLFVCFLVIICNRVFIAM